MPLIIVRNDITKMNVDAIVNAANKSLLGGGGVDGAIHRVAGPRLLEECRTLHGCETGEAKITKGYDLSAEYVIHTVGPVYRDGKHGEKGLLQACYRNSLRLAKENGCESVAFPLISAGVYGYPKQEAFQVAVDIISKFLMENDMTVYMVVFGRDVVSISKKLFAEIQEYIGDEYVEAHTDYRRRIDNNGLESAPMAPPVASMSYSVSGSQKAAQPPKPEKKSLKERLFKKKKAEEKAVEPDAAAYGTSEIELDAAVYGAAEIEPEEEEGLFGESVLPDEDLNNWLKKKDESWQQMLLRCIDEKGMTDPECYKKANIDRKLFSKIRGDEFYKPSKPTALAFAIALELPKPEIDEMLMKAGYALSRSDRFDLIISYFIQKQNYNIFEINEALFAFDQNLLGNLS